MLPIKESHIPMNTHVTNQGITYTYEYTCYQSRNYILYTDRQNCTMNTQYLLFNPFQNDKF